MFNPTDLFKMRLKAHVTLLNRYLRYIFNGHFMIALVFIIVTSAVYYERWLEEVPPTFPAAYVIAFFLAFVILYNPFQSFLKEPDKVFLIVKENEMHRYFKLAFLYNYVAQLYIVIFVLAALGPLYFEFYPERSTLLNVIVVFIVLILKAVNMTLNWHMLQVDDPKMFRGEKIVRIILTYVLVYTLIVGEHFLIVGLVYVVLVTISYAFAKKETRLHWERLIQNDLERLGQFFRFVSLFADVPHMKGKLKKRRYLAKFVRNFTPFSQTETPLYLYRLTFLRSGDYFGLYVRLTILALVFIVFVPNEWFKIVFGLLFMYMTSFQLQTLYFHHRNNIWHDLYPIGDETHRKSYLKWLNQLGMLQAAVLSLAFLAQGAAPFFFIMLGSGVVFSLSFHQLYMKKKIETADVHRS